MKQKIVIVGAGGHGRVVADAIIQQGVYEVVGFVDDSLAAGTSVWMGLKVIGRTNELDKMTDVATHFVVAIGDNGIRKKLFDTYCKEMDAGTVLHPAAVVAQQVQIGIGCQLLAGCVVSTGVTLGPNTIVNVMALVDHDTIIGAHSHVAQGVLVGSICSTGESWQSKFCEQVASGTTIS